MNPTTGAVATFVLVIVSGLFGVSMVLAAHYRQSWNRKTSPYRSVGHRHDSGVTRAKSSPSVPRQAGSITFCDQPALAGTDTSAPARRATPCMTTVRQRVEGSITGGKPACRTPPVSGDDYSIVPFQGASG
jgi:hypothetical protein